MKKKFFYLLLFISLITGCSTSYYIKEGYEKAVPEADSSLIDYRFLLIGDAGEPSPDYREPVLDAMEKRALLLPHKTLNIFLGDNVYPFGLEAEDNLFYSITKSRLDEQINVIKNSRTKGVFIPGNHDWGDGDIDGWDRVTRMGKYIDQNSPQVEILPKDGCPGPVARDYGERVRVIFIDSQWWLHNDIKPDSSNSRCYPVNKNDIANALDSIIYNSGDKLVLIAAHHPLESFGPHGGFFDWKAHLFPLLDFNRYLWIPLPVIGSLYPFLRTLGVSRQDMSNSTNKDFVNSIERIISKYKNVVYAAGHEHSLQIIRGVNNNLYMISGYGTAVHSNTLSYSDKSIFSVLFPGFIQVDVLKNNSVRIGVFIMNDAGLCEESFSATFFNEKVISTNK